MFFRIAENGTAQITTQSELDRIFDNRDDNLGWITAAIGAASAGLPFLTGLFSACKPGQACGLSGINSFGGQVMATLDQIAQMLQMGLIPPAQAMSEANRVAGSLSDSTLVYQAKKGKDAAALTNFKAQAAQKVQQITALAGQVAQRGAGNGSAGAGLSGGLGGGSGSSSSSLSPLLLFGGLGLVAVLALRR